MTTENITMNAASLKRACITLFALTLGTTLAPAAAQENDGNKAEIGQDGWLVLRDNMADYRRARAYPEQVLSRIGTGFLNLQGQLSERQATLLWVVAPNTTTIYPESVPPRIRVAPRPSLREQLSATMTKVSPQAYLDTTETLLRAKTGPHRLYRKTDTHWNDMGAFLAYQEIMRRLTTLRPDLAPRLKPVELSAFDVATRTTEGDIARMLGLQNELRDENIVLTPRQPFKSVQKSHPVWDPGAPQPIPVPPDNLTLTSDNPAACPGPRAVIYRDSYANAPLPFLLEHFCKATVIWYRHGKVDLSLVERDKPDIVLFMNVERMTGQAIRALIPD